MPNHNSAFTFSFTTEGYQGINYSSPPRAITFEVESGELTVDELCSSFQDFLKACGYMLDNGTIEFVPFSDSQISVRKIITMSRLNLKFRKIQTSKSLISPITKT
jgi:hypothetical protein